MAEFTLERKILFPNFTFPKYYLSVTWRDLQERKKRWAREHFSGRMRPEVKEWVHSKNDVNAGLVALVDTSGVIKATAPSDFLHGILYHNRQLLCAGHHEIVAYSLDLRSSSVFASFPQFNALHSLRKTRNGILVASSGTDALLELSNDGKRILWEWWATENGLTNDSFGVKRKIDKSKDHRNVEYDTWLHTAHVNAAVEFGAKILATFFIQGIFATIDRDTGKTEIVLPHLKRPHAVRLVSGQTISLADTENGVGIIGSFDGKEFVVENSISVSSVWLQDFQRSEGYWLAVDGEHSRVYAINDKNEVLGYDQFDTNWYLYEIEVV